MTEDPRMERLERHLTRLKLVSTKARLDSLLDEGVAFPQIENQLKG
jgi:hypothetical protein